MKMVKKSDKIIESAPKAVEMIRKAKPDLYITCFFLCGFPFETEQDITQTIDLAKSLDIEWAYFNMFQPFPGCELYEYCKKNDHINEFNTDNLSMYLSSKLKNTVIPAKKLEDIMYSANLLINFVNPRTIRNGNYAQALRDYERVIDVAPDHALAHYCLARTYKAMGINEKFKSELIKVIEISSKNDVQREYLTRFGINPLNLNK
jgi:radical SAM superfamily enzyme YgiQ (UPF0313 family)